MWLPGVVRSKARSVNQQHNSPPLPDCGQNDGMSRRKRYVFIAVVVLTVLVSAFVLLASYVKNGSYQAILDYEGRAE